MRRNRRSRPLSTLWPAILRPSYSYCRVSIDQRRNSGISLDEQQRTVGSSGGFYCDARVSGSIQLRNRPEGAKLLAAASRRRCGQPADGPLLSLGARRIAHDSERLVPSRVCRPRPAPNCRISILRPRALAQRQAVSARWHSRPKSHVLLASHGVWGGWRQNAACLPPSSDQC